MTLFWEYILVIFIVIEFNTPYTYFPIIRYCVFLLIYSSLIILILLMKLNLRTVLLTGALLFGGLIPALNVYEGNFVMYVSLFFIFFPLCFAFIQLKLRGNVDGISECLIVFSNIVLVIAICSLFFWSFGSIFEIISPTLYIPTEWGGDRFIPTYYGLYFETQEINTNVLGDIITRNSGIFNEAPMYNMILCFSLSVELFLKKRSLLRICVLVITIMSTLSTTGLIFITIVFSYKILLSLIKTNFSFLILLPIIALIPFFLISFGLENKRESGGESYNNRVHDIEKCIEVGMENPIIGIGIIHKGVEDGANSNSFGYSNSLFTVFAHGGLYFLTLYFFSFIIVPFIVLKRKHNTSFAKIIFSYLFLFTFTISPYRVLTLFMVSYSLAYYSNFIIGSRKNMFNRNKVLEWKRK